MKPCAVIIWDRPASRAAGFLKTRPCGVWTRHVITFADDPLFAACHRHDGRLRRAFPGIDLGRPQDRG